MLGHSCNGGDTYAYVYNADARTILYCDAFLNAHRLGKDSKAGIVVHEVSHLDVGTADIDYGNDNAQRLAIDHPDEAATNADNYEYMAEDAWRP